MANSMVTVDVRQWDIFCTVIDNYGDIGVCWRLSADLAARGHQVRLWVDDASALSWMAPQGCPGVHVLPWTQEPAPHLEKYPCQVLVEAFGCEVSPSFIATSIDIERSTGKKPAWINLEYLSAEPYALRCHGLPSPIQTGPAAGWTKWFFYPGFTAQTGGLLREPDLFERQATFDRATWLAQQGIAWQGEQLVSLFCYEPGALAQLLDRLNAQGPTRLLVTTGRATQALKALQTLCNKHKELSISYLPLLSQTDFDHLLWACDLNFVRGEDSLVRALWAGKPLVWQIYPQHDGAHVEKLEAWLEQLQVPQNLRQLHRVWNGINSGQLGPLDIPSWNHWAQTTRHALAQQDDLVSRLLGYVRR